MNRNRSSGDDSRRNGPPAGKAVELIRYYGRFHDCGPGDRDRVPYRITASGAWAASRPAHLYYFFRKLDLGRYRLFVDLGSGDGLVACLAGLFTRAVGIESDPQLVVRGARAAADLGLGNRVDFVCADFFSQRIQRADCLYIYPDKPLYRLEEALEDWDGNLLVYGPHFPPNILKLKEKLRCGKETLSVYARA